MHTFTLRRKGETNCSTWGELNGESGDLLCKILERGLHNINHVRIPAGTYQLGRRPFGSSHFDRAFSALIGPTYKGILWLPVVPGRSNIEIHTANVVQELLGCLATGEDIRNDDNGDFAIEGGTSKPAYKAVYPVLSAAIDDSGAQLVISDI